jgi:hypothetical protein
VSNFWKELFYLLGTGQRISLAYHPKSNVPTELLYRCTLFTSGFLRQDSRQLTNWLMWLDWVGLWYNTTYHVFVGMALFEVVHRFKSPQLLVICKGGL